MMEFIIYFEFLKNENKNVLECVWQIQKNMWKLYICKENFNYY